MQDICKIPRSTVGLREVVRAVIVSLVVALLVPGAARAQTARDRHPYRHSHRYRHRYPHGVRDLGYELCGRGSELYGRGCLDR